jgi:hypothetical protein
MDIGDSESKYYESIDIAEAAHAQTILAYDMNDKMLDIPRGAPLRLRVERHSVRLQDGEISGAYRGGRKFLGYQGPRSWLCWYAGI